MPAIAGTLVIPAFCQRQSFCMVQRKVKNSQSSWIRAKIIHPLLGKKRPDPKGQVTVFFELNGQPRNVVVLDEEAGKDLATREKATSENHVGAPMPGAIVAVGVKAGDSVAKGDLLVTLEAMKMETNVFRHP